MSRKDLLSSPFYRQANGSMNLSNLPKVGHLANYGTRPVSSKAGALNYGMYAKKKKKKFLTKPYEVPCDFRFYYDKQLSRSTII